MSVHADEELRELVAAVAVRGHRVWLYDESLDTFVRIDKRDLTAILKRHLEKRVEEQNLRWEGEVEGRDVFIHHFWIEDRYIP